MSTKEEVVSATENAKILTKIKQTAEMVVCAKKTVTL